MPGAQLWLSKVSMRMNLAEPSGCTMSINALMGKPIQGTVMPQASTQRKR